MRQYAQYDADGHLTGIGVGMGGVEITEEEYNRLHGEITRKATYASAVHAGRIAIEDVPEDCREEVARRVADRQAEQEDAEATEADYLSALAKLGVSE